MEQGKKKDLPKKLGPGLREAEEKSFHLQLKKTTTENLGKHISTEKGGSKRPRTKGQKPQGGQIDPRRDTRKSSGIPAEGKQWNEKRDSRKVCKRRAGKKEN